MNNESLKDLISDGLFHCTTVGCFRAIREDGAIKPNLDERPLQHGATSASSCFRLGAVSLFDASFQPKRNWLRRWMTVQKPITVAIRIDPERLDQTKLLSCAEARTLTSGLMLR